MRDADLEVDAVECLAAMRESLARSAEAQLRQADALEEIGRILNRIWNALMEGSAS